MAFESKPLKTAAQLAMEKVGLEEKKKPEEPKKEKGGLKSAAEIASEGGSEKVENEYAKRIREENAEIMAAEARIDESDIEKIKAIGAEYGINVSDAVAEKEEKVKEGMKKYFSEEESTTVKNYDKNDKEIIDQPEKPEEKNKVETGKKIMDLGGMGNEILTDKDVAEMHKAEAKGMKETEKDLGMFETGETNERREPTKTGEIPSGAEELLKGKPADNVEALPEVKINPNEIMTGKDGKKGVSVREYLRLSKILSEDELLGLMENAEEFKDKNEEAKVENQQPKEETKTKEQVQSEALKDFTNELKGIKKDKQWEGDPIMQGMEDFANSLKEKSPMTETLKDMFSFIKKKGAEINAGKLTAQKAIGEFSKKSAKWAEKIFGGKKIGKSNEALRIDEIMRGGDRSVGAIKVDQAMDKAREAGEAEKVAKMEAGLKKAENMDDLIKALNGVDTITDSRSGEHKAPDQQAFIDKLFKGRDGKGDTRFLNWIADGNGLKENVKRVFDKERKKSSAEAKAA